ncbi:unnamed protein product [Ilex paraguariensis]|uniref:NAC domain-containing protein n=1 Tax=Ilex paraguariensis TaxID=185542 RepID=A0ABC8SB17_9AQUA
MDDRTPGFRFYPTEEELVSFYLHNKLEGTRQDLDRAIPMVDIYEYNPWDLPRELCQGDPEQWFFFIPRQEREAHGAKPNRLTTKGYWKATGSPGSVYSNNRIIGVKRTMVFYRGRAPGGRKTEWKMNEYKAIAGEASLSASATPKLRQEFNLCRIYLKSTILRAFDRRPSGVMMITSEAIVCQPHQLNETSTSHQSPPMTVIRTSSPKNTSTGDNVNPPPQVVENDIWDLDVPVDNNFWLDWG